MIKCKRRPDPVPMDMSACSRAFTVDQCVLSSMADGLAFEFCLEGMPDAKQMSRVAGPFRFSSLQTWTFQHKLKYTSHNQTAHACVHGPTDLLHALTPSITTRKFADAVLEHSLRGSVTQGINQMLSEHQIMPTDPACHTCRHGSKLYIQMPILCEAH